MDLPTTTESPLARLLLDIEVATWRVLIACSRTDPDTMRRANDLVDELRRLALEERHA